MMHSYMIIKLKFIREQLNKFRGSLCCGHSSIWCELKRIFSSRLDVSQMFKSIVHYGCMDGPLRVSFNRAVPCARIQLFNLYCRYSQAEEELIEGEPEE